MIIGIDIGGTNLKAGLIDNGRIIDKVTKPTNSFDLIKQIISTVNELKENNSVTSIAGIGVGCPGIIVNGKVIESANLQLFDCDLQQILRDEFCIPVVVKNDADMATLAENKYGAGVGAKNMLLLTIGTGVGGGIIINNKLYEGNGGAGEFGHITYVKDGIECNCGRKGCFEKYVSAIALINKAKEIGISVEKVSELIDNYDENKELIDNYVEDLSNLLTSLCDVFRPEKIIIGGGITYAPRLISMTADICKSKFYGYKSSQKVEIVKANLGNDAGIMGACACFEENNL